MHVRGVWLAALCACFGLGWAGTTRAASTDDIEGKPPDVFAVPHKAFAWNSKNDLRYVWWLPKDFDPQGSNTLTVILHGRGFDYRWGWKNYKPDVLRTRDVVISVDGTSADGEHRWFSPEKKDLDAFQTFLVEVTHTFHAERVFLYGYIEGGVFALTFAAAHPESVTGVVAHDARSVPAPKLAADAPKPAIVFLHGTADPESFFAESVAARGAWSKAGVPFVHLRRLDNTSYEPNPKRVDQEIAWCEAMTTTKPELALETALDLLRVEPGESARMQTPADFAGAKEILRRFSGKGPAPFANPPAELSERAKALSDKIESAGAAHVQALKKSAPTKREFKLDGKVPIGQFAPVREDFRGVDSVEEYFKLLGFDACIDAGQKPVDALIDGWRKSQDPKILVDLYFDNLPKIYMFEGLPPDLPAKMRSWKADQKKLKLSSKSLKAWPALDDWQHGWEAGLKEYAALWKEWKGP